MNWICKQKRWISIGCFLITCVFVVFGYQSGIFTDTQKMQAFLERAGVLAPLVFMAIQAVQVVIPILPGAIGCVFGVVFFGAVKGFFYNLYRLCGCLFTGESLRTRSGAANDRSEILSEIQQVFIAGKAV